MDIQRIIDHWHVGAIRRQQDCGTHVLLNTDHGDFALVDEGGVSEQILARSDLQHSGFKAAPLTKPRGAHVEGCHYQLWRLSVIPPQERFMIRPARETDYAAVERLTRRLHRLDFRGVPGFLVENPRVLLSRSAYIGVLEDKNEAYFVAEAAGQLIGVIYLDIAVTDDEAIVPRREAEIGILFVEQAWRRKGVATALLVRAERWARGRRADRIVTIVYPYARAAAALYEKWGLRPRSLKLARSIAERT